MSIKHLLRAKAVSDAGSSAVGETDENHFSQGAHSLNEEKQKMNRRGKQSVYHGEVYHMGKELGESTNCSFKQSGQGRPR